MSETEVLRSSFNSWDTFAIWTGTIGLLALVIQFIVEFTSLTETLVVWLDPRLKVLGKRFVFVRPFSLKFKSLDWESIIRRGCVLILIAGTGSQIVAQLRMAALTSQIVAFLDRETSKANQAASAANKNAGAANERAGDANKLAAEAHERAAILEVNVETLKNDNLRITRTQSTQGKKVVELRRRRIEDAQQDIFLKVATTFADKREIIVFFPDNDDDSERYAKEISALLRKANIPTKANEWHGSPPVKPGVTVCLRNGGDSKIFDALKQAKIATDSVRFRPGLPNAPETQPHLRESFPFFCENGTIFVGFKRAVD